jgi:deoxycytidine triphosphate deaminase
MLNREEIETLIKEKKLIEGFIDLKTQLTPNGFDVTAESVLAFATRGRLDFSNKERDIPEGFTVVPQKINPEDAFGWWDLKRGVYRIKTNEVVTLPRNLIALAFTRSSLLRMGAYTQHGVWDAGFSGKSEFILAVDNLAGLRLKQNARVAQLIFQRVNETNQGYQGIHQNKR